MMSSGHGGSLQLAVVATFLLLVYLPDSCAGATAPWGPRNITVGGEANRWRYGFDYTKWAHDTAPFYVDDVLIFKYGEPKDPYHSVWRLKSLNCIFDTTSKNYGNVTPGRDIRITLMERKPHYFACGNNGGNHCRRGLMRFPLFPNSRDVAEPPEAAAPPISGGA